MALGVVTEYLKFSDKIYFNSTHYQGTLSLYYLGDQCLPVVEQQRSDVPRNFERCVFQVQQVKSQEQQNFLWGEAAETAKYVTYGQVVKLWNVFANRYLTSDGPVGEDLDRDDQRHKAIMSRGQTNPPPPGHPEESRHFKQLFRILPRYKIREVGERVRLEDQIVIDNVASSLFMHVTSITTSLTTLWKSHQETVMEKRGVSLSVQHYVDFQPREQKGAVWTMEPYETEKDMENKAEKADQYIMAGSAVVMYHREAEGFVLCDWQIQDAEHVFIDKHKIQKATFNVLDLPYSANALWIIEAETPRKGGPVMYHRHRRFYRMKHMATGLYLTLSSWTSPDGTRMHDVSTTYTPEDRNTLLALHPLDTHDTSDGLTITSFVRLCFHHEEVWLHATGEYTVDEPVKVSVSAADQFKAVSLGTTGKLQRMEITTKGYYEDVFAIRCVRSGEKENLTMVCNMVVTLERFYQYWLDIKQEREEEKRAVMESRHAEMRRGLSGEKRLSEKELEEKKQADTIMMQLKRSSKNQESSKLIQSTLDVLTTLVLFCTARSTGVGSDMKGDPLAHSGPPNRKNQMMLFQQNLHQLIFKILRAPMEFGGLTLDAILQYEQYRNLNKIYRLSYRLVKQMVKGAMDLAQHMAQFLGFIESQLGPMTTIADAFMQIICDNVKLLEQLQPIQLESFLWLIPQYGRKATYMTLLAACVVCNEEGIPRNQNILVAKLRSMEKLRLLHATKMVKDTIHIRPYSGFPSSTERKVRRFKRRRESGIEEDSGSSEGTESESEEEEVSSRHPSKSPYMSRYSPRSRSGSPQSALLQVAHNIPRVMHGAWVYTCDIPAPVPRWQKQWLQVTGGCVHLGKDAEDAHPRAIPIYMFQTARKDGVSNKNPPEGLQKFGITLVYKTPRMLVQDEDHRHERRLLICCLNMQDRLELLQGMKREIKLAMNIDDDLDIPSEVVSPSQSLVHYHAHMRALKKRHGARGEGGDLVDVMDVDTDCWLPLEEWASECDPNDEDIQYFEQSLVFLASLAVGGNENAINYIVRRITPEQVLAGMVVQLHHPLGDQIRSGYVRLARHMFIDSGRYQVAPEGLLNRFKDTVYDFITRNARQEANAVSRNHLMAQMLTLANVMVGAGCYTSDELEHLIHPLLRLLDGTSDVWTTDFTTQDEAAVATTEWGEQSILPAEPGNRNELLLEPGSPRDPGSPRTQRSRMTGVTDVVGVRGNEGWKEYMSPTIAAKAKRFAWTEKMQLVMETKLACCTLLQWLFKEAGERPEVDVRKWVSRVENIDRRLGQHTEGVFLNLRRTDLLTRILLDVTLYKGYPKLFRTALLLVFVNLSDRLSDPLTHAIEDDEKAIKRLAEVLKGDLMNRNCMLTMNLFRHFRESKEDRLTIGLLRVFRRMIYLDGSKREKEKMQCLLDDLGVTPLVTQLIESKDEEIVSEALQFGQALLEGGNRKVQMSVLSYFLSLNDEAFFSCIRDRMNRAIELVKSTESSEKHKLRDHSNISLPEATLDAEKDDPNAKYQSTNLFHLEKVLRFLQLFCEGHNRALQDYLRDQEDNVHTYNLVKETINALKHLLMIKKCDEFAFSHIHQAFNTLTEYCQGPCSANQHQLVNANITLEVNVVLMRPTPDLSETQRDELKNAALTMLTSVLEGVEDPQIPSIITQTLDFKAMHTLLSEVWQGRKKSETLDLGFTAFILLRTLAAFDDTLVDFIEKCDGFSFYTALTGRIEIWREGALVRVYFRIPFICSNLSDKTKDELLWNVNRETPTARIADFFDRAEELIYEIEFFECSFKQIREPRVGSWFPNLPERLRQVKFFINSTILWWENAMIVFGFLINAIVCASYVTRTDGEIVRRPFEGFYIENTYVVHLLEVLMACQVVVTCFILFDFLVAKAPLTAHRKKKKARQLQMKRARKKFSLKRYIEMFEVDHPELVGRGASPRDQMATSSENPPSPTAPEPAAQQEVKAFELLRSKFADRTGTPAGIGGSFGAVVSSAVATSGKERKVEEEESIDSEDREKGYLAFDFTWRYLLLAVWTDTHFIFLAASVFFALMGLFFSPFFISVHLVSIINRSALLQNVIKAVTKNGRSLLLAVLLGIIIIYLFSVVGFVLFRPAFENREPPCEGEPGCADYHCDTLFRCFIFAVTAGIRAGGGIGDLMQPPDWGNPYNAARTLFDFLFFVVVIVILLNIIFGVIIDTFAELRSEKQKVEEDIRSRCFICGIESSQFDRQAEGFENHIKNDHNMWNYIFFIHHLQKKDPDEFTGQESYVHGMMRKGDLSFFPLNKAICLEGKQEEDDQVKELTAVHTDTQKRVEQVESQVNTFQVQFAKESQEMKEYLQVVTDKVVEATAKRHSILGGLYAAIQKDQASTQEGPKMRPLTPTA